MTALARSYIVHALHVVVKALARAIEVLTGVVADHADVHHLLRVLFQTVAEVTERVHDDTKHLLNVAIRQNRTYTGINVNARRGGGQRESHIEGNATK